MKKTPGILGSLAGIGGWALLFGAAGMAQAQPAHPHVQYTASQASATALKKYPGHVVGKVNLEDEEGSWQYAVNVRSGRVLREVMVSALTGKIANVEVTSKSEEAKEMKAELKKAHNKKKG